MVFCVTDSRVSLFNGDFENTTGWGSAGTTDFPAEWDDLQVATRKNAAEQQSGVNAIGGSGTSAYTDATDSYDVVVTDSNGSIASATGLQIYRTADRDLSQVQLVTFISTGDLVVDNFRAEATAIPEPASVALAGLGSLCLFGRRR